MSTTSNRSKAGSTQSLMMTTTTTTTTKENSGFQFSPPETRSARKKKLHKDFMSGGPSTHLTFSPPNQAENARREKEEIERKEADRARRIAKMRSGRNFLQFTVTGEELAKEPSAIASKAPSDAAAASAVVAVAKKPPPVASSPFRAKVAAPSVSHDLLRQISSDVNSMKNQRENDEELVSKIQGMISNPKENAKLLEDWKKVHSELADARETFASEKARFEVQLAHAEKQASDLEQMRSTLSDQVRSLGEEKHGLAEKTHVLEKELDAAHRQVEREKEALAALQSTQTNDYQDLVQEKSELIAELENVNDHTEELMRVITGHENNVERLEKITIPELEASLECEKDKTALLETKLENLQMELDESCATMGKMRAGYEKMTSEHQVLEALFNREQINSSELQAKVEAKTLEVRTAHAQLEDLQLSMETERGMRLDDVRQTEEANHDLERKVKSLNESLETATAQLEEAQQKNSELNQRLQSALQEQKRVSEELDEQVSETAGVIEGLTDQLAQERKLREDCERQLVETKKLHREKEIEIQLVVQEREDARNNMQGFDERESELYRKLREGELIRREMHSKLMQLMGNIRVFVRVRPALSNETQGAFQPFSFPHERSTSNRCVSQTKSSTDVTKNLIEVMEPYKDRGGLKDRRKTWRFGFDQVFGPGSSQSDVWDGVQPLVQSVVDGFNVTLFAYGQTGSGKTHTMLGSGGQEGIVSRAVAMMFDKKRELESFSRGENPITISVELLEVYNEKVRDLLSSDRTQNLKVTPEEVVGNIICDTASVEEVMTVLNMAQKHRCVKATASNAVSSRSHMIFTLNFTVKGKNGSERLGKLNICDLAGSERLGKSGAHLVGGSLLEESKSINKSLSVLSSVIEQLQAGESNVRFRESKLTMILKNSLSGNSKTLAIVCCNPLGDHVNESISSLRFAEKVNRIDLKAAANFSC